MGYLWIKDLDGEEYLAYTPLSEDEFDDEALKFEEGLELELVEDLELALAGDSEDEE